MERAGTAQRFHWELQTALKASSNVHSSFQADLDSMLQWLLQNHPREDVLKAGLCTEAAALLLEMVTATVDKVSFLPGAHRALRREWQSVLLETAHMSTAIPPQWVGRKLMAASYWPGLVIIPGRRGLQREPIFAFSKDLRVGTRSWPVSALLGPAPAHSEWRENSSCVVRTAFRPRRQLLPLAPPEQSVHDFSSSGQAEAVRALGEC